MYKVLESLTSHYGSAKRPIQRLAGERFNSGCSVSGLTGLTASQKAFLWWRIEHLQALPETIQATVLKVGNSQRCNYVKLVELSLTSCAQKLFQGRKRIQFRKNERDLSGLSTSVLRLVFQAERCCTLCCLRFPTPSSVHPPCVKTQPSLQLFCSLQPHGPY